MTAYVFYIRQPTRTALRRFQFRPLAPPPTRGSLMSGVGPMNAWWWPNAGGSDALPRWMDRLLWYAEQGYHDDG